MGMHFLYIIIIPVRLTFKYSSISNSCSDGGNGVQGIQENEAPYG